MVSNVLNERPGRDAHLVGHLERTRARLRRRHRLPRRRHWRAVNERVNGTDAVIVRYAAAYDNLAVTAHNTGHRSSH
jgi:hypothetical protein